MEVKRNLVCEKNHSHFLILKALSVKSGQEMSLWIEVETSTGSHFTNKFKGLVFYTRELPSQICILMHGWLL